MPRIPQTIDLIPMALAFRRMLSFIIAFWLALVSSTPVWWNLEPRGYSPKTNVFDLTVKKVTLAPDGFSRTLSTFNGQYPGPLVEATKGDRIVLNIRNELGYPTAIHSHGIFQRGTPWFDGVSGQSQCQIPNDYTFTYDYTVPDQAGTYWYHSHAATQYVDGLVGPLIIHDPEDPYKTKYDEEIIVMLSDYHHKDSEILLKEFFTPASEGDEPVPDNGLINGRHNFNCSLAPKGSTCVNNAGLATFKFVPNKRYRLRIINTSAFSTFIFSIDRHEMEVIEVEGTYTKPEKIHRLPINVAQRYSVIVTANQPVDNYIMRSEFEKSCMPDAAIKLPLVTAIVHYDGAPDGSAPVDKPWKDYLLECIDLDQRLLQPLYEEELPEPTKKIEFVIAFHNDSAGVVKAFLNESSYVPDVKHPTLEKVFKGDVYDLPRNENALIFNKYEVLELAFINTDDGEHPFHLHGTTFWVLGTGNGTKVDKDVLNTVNPISRDTATIPASGWIVFRFKIDNPGVFGIHCHMEWHLQSGLLLQLIELPETVKKMSPPKEWFDLCNAQ